VGFTQGGIKDNEGNLVPDKLDLAVDSKAAQGVGTSTASTDLQIASHSIDANGMISFDDAATFAEALDISAATNLNSIIEYLLGSAITGTVAFVSDISDTYVFENGTTNDTLVQLVGVGDTASLSTDGSTADSIWIA
jgi:hypothetical protein